MLLERNELLGVLRAAKDRAAAGHGNTVLVQGEAGIGKTALLHAFARNAGPECRMLWGWCEALFTPRPLGPLLDMIDALDPELGAMLAQSATPERLFPAILRSLQEEPGTTVLVFEDLHWADNATLDLVKYLGRRIALTKALVILTTRSDEAGASRPLSPVLGDLPASTVTRLTLRPLSSSAVAELAGQAGRSSEELYRITGGNPFFVTELLANADEDSHGIPDSIRDAVWARLSRLSAGEREVLEMISIVPGTVEIRLIEALLGDDAADLVEGCVQRGLLRREADGDLTFRHELARQATLERLSPMLQRSMHAKVEAALAGLSGQNSPSHLARRIHHAVGAEDAARVLDLAPQAAALASRLGAHQQAASYLAMGLKYVAQAPAVVAAQMYEDWAYEASLALRDYDATIEAHHKAIAIWRELGSTEKASLNLRRMLRLHWRRGEGKLAEQFADMAVEEAEKTPNGSELPMAYSTRSQLHMLHYRFEEAIEWGNRALQIAGPAEVETRIHALNNVGAALLFSGRPGGREMMEESLALAIRHGFHDHAARAYTNFSEYGVVFYEFELAERLLSDGIAFAARHDLDATTQYLLGRQAQLRMEQGRFREAETIALGVVNIERLALVMHLPALVALGRLRARLGERDAEALLQRALQESLPTGELQRIVPARLALVEAFWLGEQIEAARDQLYALVALGLHGFRPWDLGELVVWWRRCEMPDAFPATTAQLPAPRAAELAADARLAAREWLRLGVPYEAALSLMHVGGVEAGNALADAVTIFEEIEARPAAALARKLAQRIGMSHKLPKARRGPYAASRRHPLGLTNNEQEVLILIADGKTNKEVARTLRRSPRTIEHQVSAVLSKFNVANRMEVLLRLRAEPWLLQR